jgi:hypothetical protein
MITSLFQKKGKIPDFKMSREEARACLVIFLYTAKISGIVKSIRTIRNKTSKTNDLYLRQVPLCNPTYEVDLSKIATNAMPCCTFPILTLS